MKLEHANLATTAIQGCCFVLLGTSPLLLLGFLPSASSEVPWAFLIVGWIAASVPIWLFAVLGLGREYDWYLEEDKLLKIRRKTGHEAASFSLKTVAHWQCRREVPFVGHAWCLRLVLRDSFVSTKLWGLKLTEPRRYSLQFLSDQAKETLLHALGSVRAGAG